MNKENNMAMIQNRTWWKEAVVYQIYPRSFFDSNNDGIGDIDGIRKKLSHVKELGADVIWLCPVYKSPNDDNGYDISDYYDIMDEFGTMSDMKSLINEAHESGLKLIMDLVVNHTSDEHEWFKESRKSKTNEFSDYYIWKDPVNGKEPNNWGACFGGSAWEYVKERNQYYLHSFSKKQPDLNWENTEVRDAVYSMMHFWGKLGIDGFRMDVITMISKDQSFEDGFIKDGKYGDPSPYTNNGPRVHEFIREMNDKVISHYNWLTVGEGAGCDSRQAIKYVDENRKELNMLFTFEHINVGKKEANNKYSPAPFSLPEFKKAIAMWQNALADDGWNSIYLENHDQTRSISRYGNEGRYYLESGKMLATLLLTLKGSPYIYQGEEIGMLNYPFENIQQTRDIASKNDYKNLIDLDYSDEKALSVIREISRDNSRTPMQWNDDVYSGFSKTEPWIAVNANYRKINVEKAQKDPSSIFNFYKSLIKFRKANDILIYGKFEIIDETHEKIFSYYRSLEGIKIQVILNFSDDLTEYEIPRGKILVNNYNDIDKGYLLPYQALVISLQEEEKI